MLPILELEFLWLPFWPARLLCFNNFVLSYRWGSLMTRNFEMHFLGHTYGWVDITFGYILHSVHVLALRDISIWLVQVREYDRSYSRSPSRDSRRSYSRSRSPYISRSRSRSLSHSYSGRSRRFILVAPVKYDLYVCITVNLNNWSSVKFCSLSPKAKHSRRSLSLSRSVSAQSWYMCNFVLKFSRLTIVLHHYTRCMHLSQILRLVVSYSQFEIENIEHDLHQWSI